MEHTGILALGGTAAIAGSAVATPDGMEAASENYGTVLDAGQVLKKCFDATNNGIHAVLVSATSVDHGTTLNAAHVWKKVYDPTNTAIRMVMV